MVKHLLAHMLHPQNHEAWTRGPGQGVEWSGARMLHPQNHEAWTRGPGQGVEWSGAAALNS